MPTKFSNSLRHLIIAILMIELCGVCLLTWPLLDNFDKFALGDWGGYLVAHYLVQQGKLPVTDFGWQYGLLPLFLQNLWFHLAAATPVSFLMLSLPFALITTVALGRFANLEGKAPGHILLFVSLPFIVEIGDLPHVLDRLLLCVGLLRQAQGKRNQSLAFATAACFAKPAMGYLYGLVLLILIVLELRRQGGPRIPALARSLMPAVCTGLGFILLLSITFGRFALFNSLIPVSGARAYRVLNYGWRGAAWSFFHFPGVRIGYYFGTPVTFWVCATLYLAGSVALLGKRVLQGRPTPANSEIVVTCALLHLGLLVFFYGPPNSWSYYACVLVMGIVATDFWSATSAKLVWGLCVIAALANYAEFGSSIKAWNTMTQSPVTADLFAPPAEATEWSRVASIASKKDPAIFSWDGGAEVLFPWLPKPVGAFIIPGIATDSEIQHKLKQLRSAETVIIPVLPGWGDPIGKWPGPEFQTALDGTKLVFKGSYFEVYQRAAIVDGTSPH
jgi:hypothetical protein